MTICENLPDDLKFRINEIVNDEYHILQRLLLKKMEYNSHMLMRSLDGIDFVNFYIEMPIIHKKMDTIIEICNYMIKINIIDNTIVKRIKRLHDIMYQIFESNDLLYFTDIFYEFEDSLSILLQRN
tara:strand:- start:450 stop:827 length:378 start_codon:yes stop_codon:yes gene_type:complete